MTERLYKIENGNGMHIDLKKIIGITDVREILSQRPYFYIEIYCELALEPISVCPVHTGIEEDDKWAAKTMRHKLFTAWKKYNENHP